MHLLCPQSVLQQATSFSQDGAERADEGGDANASEGLLLSSLQARHTMAGGRQGRVAGGCAGSGTGAAGVGATSKRPSSSCKKQGVSGESSDPGSSATEQTTFPKDFRCLGASNQAGL